MAVTRLEITHQSVVLDGQAFGAAGAYEKIAGVLRFGVDPTHPANQAVTDLALQRLHVLHAAHEAHGFVHADGLAAVEGEGLAQRLAGDLLQQACHLRQVPAQAVVLQQGVHGGLELCPLLRRQALHERGHL
jgi:hypothetical protein